MIFKLSIDTTKSFWIAYAVLIVLVNRVNTDSVERFFLAPIWLCNNKAYSSAISAIYFIITLFKILLRVFFRVINQ